GSLRTRTLIVAGIFAVGFLGLLGRLGYLQVLKHDEYLRLAESQHGKAVALRPKRGPILDRHGQVLAVSSGAETLYALPHRIDDAGRLARRLAPLLGEPSAEVARRFDSAKRFVFVKRRLPPPTAQAVRELKEPALGFLEESLRLYPNRELAAHVVGFEGAEGKGLGGIEQAWDAHLAGQEGRALVERDALGREVTGAPVVLKVPHPGQGVMLTLDATLQYIAEKEIDAAWRRTRARAAMAVALDPRTGDVLAIAIRPTFNPNAFSVASDDERRNRAVTDPFEPGSTFKVILAAAALEEGVVRPGDRLYGENGAITIARTTIHDWKKYGWLTFSEVLQNSSNVGSIKVGLLLGKERYYKHMTGFGFGTPTGLGLPGESRGQLRAPDRWSGLSLATMSIGQEISATALQIVSAFGAVAHGGRLMQPRIVRALLDGNGREVQRFEPRVVRQVISPETARTLTGMMTRVVSDGTGHNAAIAGFEVAGKTGTAQKLDPVTRRYSRAPGVLSFVGFAPADDPRIAMLVMLDEPKNERWGSEAAAPIFAAIGREALRYLHAPPKDTAPVQIVRPEPGPAPAEATAGVRERVRTVIATVTPGVAEAGEREPGPAVMPAMVGLSLRQAMETLAPLEVRLEVAGRGVVTGQAPAAGAPLPPGALARLTLHPPSARR
ncbi:MAG TPA: penicillin-binding transpeptidase domain-containing protein, partial [Pseudomonadales bacterium]|nr:penicillin-binding transpeptidase domain-containing protein [Pseudomonadales bacterium]